MSWKDEIGELKAHRREIVTIDVTPDGRLITAAVITGWPRLRSGTLRTDFQYSAVQPGDTAAPGTNGMDSK